MEAQANRPLIRAVHRALSLIEVVGARPDGITLAQVTRETNLHPSTAFHLLQTMVALGFVTKDRTTKTYRLGPKVFHFASSDTRERQLTEIATPFLEVLARRTSEGASLAIRENDRAVIIARVDGSGRLRVVDRIGDADPLYCTAVGKVLLAFLPQKEQHILLARLRLQPKTPKTITTRAGLEKEIRRIRANGYAVDDEELALGVRCLAAPVFKAPEEVAAAIAVRGPAIHFTRSRIPTLAKNIVAASRHLSRRLSGGSYAPRRPTRRRP
jgi:DNA-binding IclR family transcriptional regulator